ncbi:hypothetical protein [Kitasatospora aureofaciens]|uniref:hypothetical protein n=1 Tax=Kitasatospora aureofaciens TaxID=1894 RepID=UPI0033DD92F5
MRNYDYDEAAEKLRCKRRFLEDRIRRLPHMKLGESVAFCDCDLALIQRIHSVIPAEVEHLLTTPDVPPQSTPNTPVTPLHAIRPSQGRKRTARA